MNKERDFSENTQRFTSNNTYQENRGKRWSSEEDMYLLQQIAFMSYSDIGKHLKRSENAVLSRLKKLAFHMIQNGEEPQVVQTNLKLSDEDIEQIRNECFIYPKKINNKFITSVKKPVKKGYFTPQQQNQEIQLLLEIRSMLRKLLYQGQQHESQSPRISYRSSTKSMKIHELNIEDLEKRSEEFARSTM